jgi:hypothetical protein
MHFYTPFSHRFNAFYTPFSYWLNACLYSIFLLIHCIFILHFCPIDPYIIPEKNFSFAGPFRSAVLKVNASWKSFIRVFLLLLLFQQNSQLSIFWSRNNRIYFEIFKKLTLAVFYFDINEFHSNFLQAVNLCLHFRITLIFNTRCLEC